MWMKPAPALKTYVEKNKDLGYQEKLCERKKIQRQSQKLKKYTHSIGFENKLAKVRKTWQ